MKIKILIPAFLIMFFSVSQSFAQKGHSGGRHRTGTSHIKDSKKTDPSTKPANKPKADKKKNKKTPNNKPQPKKT